MLSTLIILLVVGIVLIPLMCLSSTNKKSSEESTISDIMQELEDEGFDAEEFDDADVEEIKEILREYDLDEEIMEEIDEALSDEDEWS